MSKSVPNLFQDISEDKSMKLEEVAKIRSGRRPPKGSEWLNVPTPHPFIRVTDIGQGIVTDSNLVFISDENWNQMSTTGLESGDVLVSIAGSIGKVGIVPEHLNGAALTENIARISVDKSILSPEYLAEFLMSPEVQKQMRTVSNTTVIPKLSLRSLSDLRVPILATTKQLEVVATIQNGLAQVDAFRTRLRRIEELTGQMGDAIRNQVFSNSVESTKDE